MRFRPLNAAATLLCVAAAAILPVTPAHADEIRRNQWHLAALRVAEAHKISRGSGVVVAVIDTGVDPHPDLRKNVLPGSDIVPGGSGDGRRDEDGHGTAMAGLIAAHGQGINEGALGIAPDAKILPIRDSTARKTATATTIATGIRQAIAKKADIISISSSTGLSPALKEAVADAIDADIVVLGAAGNNPDDFGVVAPAIIDGVVAVGATDRSGGHASVSVTGEKVEISAPGINIHSTSKGGRYRSGTGTSPATAIVAGAAALVRSKFPKLSAKEVIHRLTATATDKGAPGRDPEYGYGLLNLVAALTADVPPLNSGGGTGITASATPPASAPTAVPTLSATGSVAQPQEPASGSSGILALGMVAVAVVGGAGALIALLLTRRRRNTNG